MTEGQIKTIPDFPTEEGKRIYLRELSRLRRGKDNIPQQEIKVVAQKVEEEEGQK